MRIALPTEAYDKNPRMGHVSVGCGRGQAGAGPAGGGAGRTGAWLTGQGAPAMLRQPVGRMLAHA